MKTSKQQESERIDKYLDELIRACRSMSETLDRYPISYTCRTCGHVVLLNEVHGCEESAYPYEPVDTESGYDYQRESGI